MFKYKLGVIGAGFMATAIIKGAIKSKILNANEIIVSDVYAKSLEKIATTGVFTTQNNTEIVNDCEFVLFAIKPQNLNDVLDSIVGGNCKKFISIMAGVKKAKITSRLPGIKVARCMPNTPCSIGCGAVGVDLSDYDNENDVQFIKNLLSSFAIVVPVPETKLNAVTGISGSSPAYFYLFLKGLIDSGVRHGLSEEESKILAVNTMIGAGKMVLENSEKSLDDLISAVCSKGGTTIEAINVYNNNGLNDITNEAVDACINRAFELENL